MLFVFGIKNCDTCKKARKYFAANNTEFQFHDIRTDGIDKEILERWANRIEWTQLLNKRSLTWRKIPEPDRRDLNRERALALMIDNPTVIKRPVLESGSNVAVGCSAENLAKFSEST